ncbi:hypothetical protein AB0283_05050 [Micromonospora vinacea]|uniref:hypothetical protein n=1 Tax=Micromonospora vinacea TaxID=709878 RepID=UPI003450A65F
MTESDATAVTSDGVMRALAALGRPAKAEQAVTDRDLPTLLGALLAVVETEISEHVKSNEKLSRLLDGQISQTGGAQDPTLMLLLAALRLGRTGYEFRAMLDESGQPDHPIMSLAVEATRAASVAANLHLGAAGPDQYGMTEADFREQLATLRESVQETARRYNVLAEMLPGGPQ